MAIFVIFRVSDPTLIGPAIEREFPADHLKLQEDEWLVSFSGTARQMSEAIGLPGGELGSAIVFSMANYYGRATTDIWDWIKAKAEKPGG